jgi:hypothetical protein
MYTLLALAQTLAAQPVGMFTGLYAINHRYSVP